MKDLILDRIHPSIIKNLQFKGVPSENRVLVVTPRNAVTKSGIYIPKDPDKEVIPKKGQVIQIGPITEEYKTYQHELSVGDIVTYGLYAGKEIELPYLEIDQEKFSITILSLNEVLYIEYAKYINQ